MANDSDHRKVANHILKTANTVVTTERGNQHGGAEDSFQMIADLWMVYLNNTNRGSCSSIGIVITPKDVAMMMDLLKTARHVHGDPMNDDNFIDKAGYTGLAAALAGIQVPTEASASTKSMAQQAAEHHVEAAATRAIAKAFVSEITTKHTEIQGQDKK